ncbi:MAG: 3-dehydroquinate synthase II, partial [Candidatus Bathyarchaeia archaeon]
MKELWVRLDKSVPKNVRESLLELAVHSCDALYVDENLLEDVKRTGAKTASTSSDSAIQILDFFDLAKVEELKNAGKPVAVRVVVKGKEDEEKAVKAATFSPNYLIISCLDWKVIPLENLIAKTRGKSKLLAEVSSFEDAKTALETLELGADGIVLKTSDTNELTKVAFAVKKQIPKIKLVPLKVVEVKRIGTGARVCVDTCDLMKKGEGILVGCQSACLFLVEAEVHENPFVNPRPFRVNAGPVSLYTLCSLDKTRYLSELKAGEEISIEDESTMEGEFVAEI